MADYPSSVKNFSTLYDGTNKVIAAHPNDRGDEITALETLIGAFGTGQGNLVSLKTLLIDWIMGCHVEYKTAADLYVRKGEIAITDASNNIRWRRNTSDLTVDWNNIDTGSEAASTTYYVYACADNAGTTFTVKISINSTTPSGMTFYRKIGSFVNDAGSDIERASMVRSEAFIALTGTVANGGTIPLPEGYTNEQCKCFVSVYSLAVWGENAAGGDDNFINCSVNDSRVATVTCVNATAGTKVGTANYLIIGTKK